MSQLELQYIHGGVVTYPPGARFGPRTLPDFELVWIIRGDVRYHAGDAEYTSPSGSMVIGRPGFVDAFDWDPRQPTRHAFLHFMASQVPHDWPRPADWPVVVPLPEGDIVRPLFRYVLAGCQRQGRRLRADAPANSDGWLPPTLTRAMEALLAALIVGPIGMAPEPRQDLPPVVDHCLRHMRRVLDRDPMTTTTLVELARQVEVSREHLCRVFRASLGVGPMEAWRLLRLDLAVQLLARSNLSVAAIARRCGFATPDHFCRRFKQVYEKSPNALRHALQAGHPRPLNQLLVHHPHAAIGRLPVE